jgi:hypothetical protein
MTTPTGVTTAKNKIAIAISVQISESREGNVAGPRSPMPKPGSDNEPVIFAPPQLRSAELASINRTRVGDKSKSPVKVER